MPYIRPDRRRELEHSPARPKTAGELNYVVTMHVLAASKNAALLNTLRAAVGEEVSLFLQEQEPGYETYNAVIGALTAARMEYARRLNGSNLWHRGVEDVLREALDKFYRDFVAPYEDHKIEQNGDVYP
jgi:hypothetical protein